MRTANGRIVTMTYTVRLSDGTEIESADKEPVSYLHGAGMLLPSLETATKERSSQTIAIPNTTPAPSKTAGAAHAAACAGAMPRHWFH